MAANDTFAAKVPMDILEDAAFEEWEDDLDGSLFTKIEAAKSKITNDGVITSAKDLKEGLFEKKWASGLRMYFAIIEHYGRKTLLLLGSGKGDQKKAISKARERLLAYKVVKENIKLN